MVHALRRHGDDSSIVELEASGWLFQGPGDELVRAEFGLLRPFHRLTALLSVRHPITASPYVRHSAGRRLKSKAIEDPFDPTTPAFTVPRIDQRKRSNEKLAAERPTEIVSATFEERAEVLRAGPPQKKKSRLKSSAV
jgi:hypothetical protein